MYSIKVQSNFSAAHNLRAYQGKCENLHGHNWKVEAEVSAGELNKSGMVCDFKEIKRVLGKITDKLDHNYLNKIPYFKKNNPTSEKVAEFLYLNLEKTLKDKRLRLESVSVWESKNCRAIFKKN